MQRLSILLLTLVCTSCGFSQVAKSRSDETKWSVRMANSVVTQSDSLIYYVDRNPKWAYDVAFLGMAIDKLGNVDPVYSKYLEDWVNYFVQPDGSIIDYKIEEYNLDRIIPGRDVMTL